MAEREAGRRRASRDLGGCQRTPSVARTPRSPADMGQQDPPGEIEEAKTATGAVDSPWPGRRSIGLPHLHLRRHHGWQIETTFQELRAHLGLETTRGWWPKTAQRAAPCLFGLYTAVALLYQALPAAKRSGAVTWPGKGGDVLRRAVVGPPVAVVGVGFATGRWRHGPRKTPPTAARTPPFGPRP